MIELKNLGKRFGKVQALSDVSLTMPEGSFTTLLGPSGCGKSTTLRIIAGLDYPTTGSVCINRRDVTELTASERNIAMVFQSYALYPHMTVRMNITLPLMMRNMSRLERMPIMDRILPSARKKMAENAAKARSIAEMLEIDELMDRKPSELSGGQMQRVAVGRALVRDPVAFLLDEPLSNLDAKLRTQMRGEIVDLHKRTGRTFIYVTHDQAEAMSMSDRIAVFMAGKIVQVATPRELFDFPATRDVAAFVGDRPINLIELDMDGASLPAPFDAFAVAGNNIPKRVIIGVRPETVKIDPKAPLSGYVERLEYLGSEAIVSFRLNSDQMLRITLDTSSPFPSPGERACFQINQAATHLFDAETGVRLQAKLVLKKADARRGA